MHCWKCSKELPSGLDICPACHAPIDPDVVDHMQTNPDGMADRVQILPGVTVAGRYQVKERIGEGGMGQVFLARDLTLDEDLALKALPTELSMSPKAVTRLKQEVQIARTLSHEHLLRIHNFEVWEGQAYVTMEYVPGQTLAHEMDKAKDHKLTLAQALPYLRQIAKGLDYAHRQEHPVVHRDIKPMNILLDHRAQVKIADFGLSRVIHDSMSHISNSTAGSPAYMAPEQMRGKGITPQTDVYALACVAYEMLAGDPPFASGDLQWQIIHEQPEPIKGQPDTVNKALLAGLAKESGDRPQTAGDFVALLAGEKEGAPSKQSQKKVASSPLPRAKIAAGVAITAVLGGGLYFGLQPGQETIEPSASNTGSEQPVVLEKNQSPSSLATLLPECKSYLDDYIYLSPEGANAYDCYQKVFTLDKNNKEARAGIDKIIAFYLHNGKNNVQEGGIQNVDGYVEQLRKLDGGEPAARELEQAKAAFLAKQVSSAGESYTDTFTGMEFVYVPKDCYQMGSNEVFSEAYGMSPTMPVHEVCLDGFYMGRTEVTQAEYEKVMGSNPSWSKNGGRYPVTMVSWDDTQVFIKKLNQQTGKSYRLPTEAEWEYAARSGGKDEKYSGGNDVDAVAWYSDNSGERTHFVGTKQANGLGLYDMSGNVWEWCQDWYGADYYQHSPRQNPQGPDTGLERVTRGHDWDGFAFMMRTTSRRGGEPTSKSGSEGFRLVLSPDKRME